MRIYIQHTVTDRNIEEEEILFCLKNKQNKTGVGVPFAKVQIPKNIIMANQCPLPMKRNVHLATILPVPTKNTLFGNMHATVNWCKKSVTLVVL